MATEASNCVVRALERKSNRLVAELDSWESLEFTTKLRRVGYGKLGILADDLPAEAIALLAQERLTLQVTREWHRTDGYGVESRISEEYVGPAGAFEWTARGDPMFSISFTDNLIYLAERAVDTDGVEYVDPGNVSAVEYVRTLLNSELLTPTDTARAIDVPATLAGLSVGGGTVDLPVRWKSLGDAIEQACIAGDIGVRAPVNSDRQIAFEAFLVRDRTSGSSNAVILSAENTGSFIRYMQDARGVKNRVYVLGANEAASRDVRVVTAAGFVVGDRLREIIVDARHLSTTDEYDAHGEAVLAERGETQRTVEVTEADREFDIRVGDRVTLEERLRSDSAHPEIGPVDVLCLGRTVRVKPGQMDSVTIEIGSEAPTTASILRASRISTEQARFV